MLRSAGWQDPDPRHIRATADRPGLPLHRRAQHRRGCAFPGPDRSYSAPKKIDDRKYCYPYDVERMPEKCKAKQATQDIGAKALGENLRHHGEKPEAVSYTHLTLPTNRE